MNTLVIYDSTFGNTEKIAQAIAEVMAERGPARTLRVSKVQSSDLEGIDLLMLGCPTHKRKPTDAVQAFLECVSRKSLSGISAAVFDTRYRKPRLLTGSAAGRLAKSLRKAGAALLTSPQSFFVLSREGPLEEGETERAATWAREIPKSFAARNAG
jgi:flavodoxin